MNDSKILNLRLLHLKKIILYFNIGRSSIKEEDETEGSEKDIAIKFSNNTKTSPPIKNSS